MSTPSRTNHGEGASSDPGSRIVEFALRAPSVHNTQPWSWHVGDHRLDLYADRTRQLPVSDPDGRNLVISCGAALHYAIAGASSLGWAAATEHLPGPDDDHLAALCFTPHPPTREAVARAELLRTRRTDRRRFIGWPVPTILLHRLACTTRYGTASAVPVTSLVERLRVELLVSRAMFAEDADQRFVSEQQHWVDGVRRATEGIPSENATPGAVDRLRPTRPSRFEDRGDRATDDDSATAIPPSSDGLIVIVTRDDDPASWLDAGDVLCRLWVAAMEHGLSLVPVSQPIEVPETRDSLRFDILHGEAHPVLLARLGWQVLSRSALPPTPRRPLDEVLGT